jgi:glycosyltransferase involved in cell wall biosynthesis
MRKTKFEIAVTSEFLCHEIFTGVEYYLYNLIHSIAVLNRVHLNLICPPGTPRELIPENTVVHQHKPFDILGTKFVSALINTPDNLEQYDLVHCPTVVAPFFFKPRKNKELKVVMTVHDLIPNIFPKLNIIRRRIYFKYILKYRFRYVDYYIVPSNAVRNDLIKIFNIKPNRISVIHEGISDKFRASDNIRKEKYILAVSTLEPRKNFKRIIECYIDLKKNNNIEEKLVIVGKKGWYFKDILKIPEELSKDIIFKGYVPEYQLIELYQKAKLFIYPSLYEGFGLPILEAMASGCPVITSNTSSLPEVAGDAAFLVNPTKKTEIENAILNIIQNKNLADDLIYRGLKRARNFSWNQCAEKTISVYEKVIAN